MKKLLSAGIILALMTSLLALSSSAAPDLEGEVLPVLGILGVMNGDERGELNLTAPVTRAQFVKMAVACSALKTTGQAGAYISPYPDVRAGTWYAPAAIPENRSGRLYG
ncbi:MAG: S-layer homology domain-containing protein, partial [Ruminococcaceae bacterium]|nr:S-layer homology domain-containing protein [Oscillospiraceae bacterium]